VSDIEKSTPSRSFVGRWSQRKLQKKSEKSHKHTERPVAEDPTDNVLLQDALTNHAIHPMIVPESEGDAPMRDAQAPDAAPVAAHSTEPEVTEASGEDEEPLLTDADMPDIKSLTEHSDVSPFMNRGVSAALRKAALKYVFSLPGYNIRDGLNDYDEDYTVWEPLGDTVTCDMKFHKERKERERLERERLEAEAKAAQEEQAEAEEAEAELTEEDQAELAAESNNETEQDDAKSNDDASQNEPLNFNDTEQPDNKSESNSHPSDESTKTGSGVEHA